ncbi:MAG: TetR/AcrR family transcriptional regulator, partial [Moraxellaceae bacterium]
MDLQNSKGTLKTAMPRPKGSRDRDYEARRQALMALARAHLSSPSGRSASWRELAAACQVSVSTMNHYFKGRGDLIAAIIENAEKEGAPYLVQASTPSGPFPQSIAQLVMALSFGFEHGVLALQIIGIGEGFADRDVSSAFLGHHLEPVLGAIAARLETHINAGEMAQTDTHFAAISLLSPLLVAHLHQTALGGHADYP